MQLASIEHKDIARLCPLRGIKVTEVRIAKGTLESVTLQDGDGTVMAFLLHEHYGKELHILLKAPPEKVKKYAVTGELPGGIKINESFDDQNDASERKNEFSRLHLESSLVIEPIEVEVEAP